MTESRQHGRSERGSGKEPSYVRTSVRDGRKYVDSNELLRTKKARAQIKQLQEMFGSERAQR